jgi:hypothetical protein
VLREIPAGRRNSTDGLRRWFQDGYFDLFVWHAADGAVIRFQLCYERDSPKEGALTWDAARGYTHDRIDDGERGPGRIHAASPLLVANGAFPLYRIRPRFESAAEALDTDIRTVVLARLRDYPRALYGPLRQPRRRRAARERRTPGVAPPPVR